MKKKKTYREHGLQTLNSGYWIRIRIRIRHVHPLIELKLYKQARFRKSE